MRASGGSAPLARKSLPLYEFRVVRSMMGLMRMLYISARRPGYSGLHGFPMTLSHSNV